jgi:hypothetical protein
MPGSCQLNAESWVQFSPERNLPSTRYLLYLEEPKLETSWICQQWQIAMDSYTSVNAHSTRIAGSTPRYFERCSIASTDFHAMSSNCPIKPTSDSSQRSIDGVESSSNLPSSNFRFVEIEATTLG